MVPRPYSCQFITFGGFIRIEDKKILIVNAWFHEDRIYNRSNGDGLQKCEKTDKLRVLREIEIA